VDLGAGFGYRGEVVGEKRGLIVNKIVEEIPHEDEAEAIVADWKKTIQHGGKRLGVQLLEALQTIVAKQRDDSDSVPDGRVELQIGLEGGAQIEHSDGSIWVDGGEDLGEGG
jgi:hypothetical protein